MKQIQETKLIVITREDISDGYKAVQSRHSNSDFAYEFPDTFRKWKEESNSIICLSVKNELELKKLHHKFQNITDCVLFFEPDINETTSLCLYGTPDVRRILQKLPLLLKNKKQNYEN